MKFIAGAITMLLVIGAVAGFVLATGRFNVAATAPHDFTDNVARGLTHYRENCLPCHGAPGVDAAEFPEGMNPSPPGIDADEVQHGSDAELFWVIKNGIRMSGMAAFGVNHKDEEIRDIVAFVRHVRQLTDAEREALKAAPEGEEHHHEAAPPASPAPAASASPYRRD
jgi:mono/diheme cytochrome c family protein